MIAYRHEKLEWTEEWTLCSFLALLRSQVKMNAHDYYCLDAPKAQLSESSVSCIHNWERLAFVSQSLPSCRPFCNQTSGTSFDPTDPFSFDFRGVYDCSEARVLQEYRSCTSYKICDLNQSINQPRGELKDGTLPTLTTSSGKLYSEDKSLLKSCFKFKC